MKRDIHHTLGESAPVDIELVDTHCHIQLPDYGLDADMVIKDAADVGVTRMIVVGCTLADSEMAINFVKHRDSAWASIGLHPHESSVYVDDDKALQHFRDLATKPKVVAIGEIGLDYYYEHSKKEDQIKMLRFQLEMAQEHDLPVIFHVRDAFDDFWPIFDSYKGLRGVIHSFTSNIRDLEQILSRGLYVGLNGIMTFTTKPEQLEAAKAVPKDKLVLETDAPYLTPKPFRGTICQLKHVRVTGEFLADLRGESLMELAGYTTTNARKLFNI